MLYLELRKKGDGPKNKNGAWKVETRIAKPAWQIFLRFVVSTIVHFFEFKQKETQKKIHINRNQTSNSKILFPLIWIAMAALQYLESLRNAHPELSDWYNSLADLYQKKLWHQLTLKLEQFVALAVFQVCFFGFKALFTCNYYWCQWMRCLSVFFVCL